MKKNDLQQIKTMPLPKSPPATAITYKDHKKSTGTKVNKQTIKDAK